MRYHLASNVYLAVVDRDIVLLDAAGDRYACLAACDAEAIRRGADTRCWADEPLVSELAAAGYLSPRPGPIIARPQPPTRPTRDLHLIDRAPVALRYGDLVRGTIAALATAGRLWLQRPRHWLTSARDGDADQERAIALAYRFDETMLYLPGLTRCLPRSLALIDFLHFHGSTAQLVFGVRTHPFEAHCWVQAGDTVLNDNITRVSWYMPIAWS